MIKIEVFSEEKAWSKKIKNKEIFFKKICNFFPRKYRFPQKKITLTLLLSNNRCIKKLNKNFKEKVVKTFIHGYLHLLGFDHIKDKEYRRMVSEEEKIYKSVISKIN